MFTRFFLLCVVLLGLTRLHAQTDVPAHVYSRHADIVYLADGTSIARFDLAAEQWLASIEVGATPAALLADSSGLFYAVDRTVYRRALDGSGTATPLYNAIDNVKNLVSDANLLFIGEGTYNSRLYSIRKSDWQYVAMWNNSSAMGNAIAISASQRKIYGSGSSSSSTTELAYAADGTFGSTLDASALSGSGYTQYPRLVLSPTERTLARNSGMMYSVPGIVARSLTGGVYIDAAFHGDDVVVILRGGKLEAYDNASMPAGTYTLAAAGARAIVIRSGQVYAFRPDATSTPKLAVEKVAVSSLTAAVPGAAVDPARLNFLPDGIVQAEDGSLLMLSKAHQSIFRWSAAGGYTASYPLPTTPQSFTYSPTNRRLYVGYPSGVITYFNLALASPTETVFASVAGQPSVLVPMGDLLYVGLYTYSSESRILNAAGGQTGILSLYNNYGLLWSATDRRLITIGGSWLYATPISADGVPGTTVSSGYVSPEVQTPARLSGDGAVILGTNGQLFSAATLQHKGSLANAFRDAAWLSTRWASIRAAGSASQVQLWTTAGFMERGFTLPGYPYRLFALPDGRLVGLTTVGGNPDPYYSYNPQNAPPLIFSIIDPAGAGTVSSSPGLTSALPATANFTRGRAATLAVQATGEGLTYQWYKDGEAIAGATTASLAIGSVVDADAGAYAVVVANAVGSVPGGTTVVTVVDPPPAPVITSQPYGSYVAVGGSAYFYVYTSGSGLTYQWRFEGVDIPGATGYSLSLSNLTAEMFGTYDVVVSNAGGAVTSTPAELREVVPVAITMQPVSATTPAGTTATFTIAATGTPAPQYRWYQKPPGYTYWFEVYGEGGGSGTLVVAASSLAMSGTQYRCAVWSDYSSSIVSDTVVLTVTGRPQIISSASTTFLVGQSNSFVVQARATPVATFTATGLPGWAALDAVSGVLSGTPPSTAAAPFTITVTASNGVPPDAVQIFTLHVQAIAGAPEITVQPANRTTGVGGEATFSITATGTEPMSYQWTKDGEPIAGANGPSLTVSNVTVGAAGYYRVSLANAAGATVSNAALLSVLVDSVSASHSVVGGGYLAGQTVTITNTLQFTGAASALAWEVLLPEGWSFVGSSGQEGEVKPVAGATGLIEWAWTTARVAPVTFTYTLAVPAEESADRPLAALVTVRTGETPTQLLALPDPLVVRRRLTHSADTNGDNRISVFELTRVIELYNTRNGVVRTGCYAVRLDSEDGYKPDATRADASASLPAYHSADYNRDGRISVLELTRVIELYNYRVGTTRTGQYRRDISTTDGFAPGP